MATERPNKKAMGDVLDSYRDAMRPFIVRYLRRVRGGTVEDAIKLALGDRQRSQFEQNLREGRSVEDSIDINDFPQLVNCYWREVFRDAFKSDSEARDTLWLIARARNQVSHPKNEDLDAEYVRARLYDIASVLKDVGAQESSLKVESIRQRLIFATTDTQSDVETPRKNTDGGRPRTEAKPVNKDASRRSVGSLEIRNLAGYAFKLVEVIQPERDERGKVIEERVSSRDGTWNKHGQGPFCRFRVAEGWRECGVWLLVSGDAELEVGACGDLEMIWSRVGRIKPYAVVRRGTSTHCKNNNRILNEIKRGSEISLWFRAIPDNKQREECREACKDALSANLRLSNQRP